MADESTGKGPPADPRERAKARGKRIAFLVFGLFAAWFIISSTYQITKHALFP